MHRDKKLGLALALLVIGFAGAFCYRNDQFGLLSDAPQQKENSPSNKSIAAGNATPRPSRSRRDREEEELSRPQQQTVASATSSYRRDDESPSRQIAPLDASTATQKVTDGYSSQNEFDPNPFGDLDEFDNFLKDNTLSQKNTNQQNRAQNNGSTNSLVSQTENSGSRQYHSPEHNQLWEEETNSSSEIVAESDRSRQYNQQNLNNRNQDKVDRYQTNIASQDTHLSDSRESIALKQNDRSPRNTDSQFTSFPDLLSENEVNQSGNSLPKTEPSPFEEVADLNTNETEPNHFVSQSSPRARLNQSIETDDGTYNFLQEENDPFAETPASSQAKQEVADYRQSEPAQSNSYRKTYPTVSKTRLHRPEFSNSSPADVQSESRDIAGLTNSESLPKVTPKSEPQLQAGQMLIHQVRKNETLSGLASRYLGSSRKYMQIYNANRDILSNPNDIRIGMKLRIPKREQTGSTQAWNVSTPQTQSAKLYQNPKYSTSQHKAKPEVESLPDSTPQSNSNYGSPANKFQPFSRSPFQH